MRNNTQKSLSLWERKLQENVNLGYLVRSVTNVTKWSYLCKQELCMQCFSNRGIFYAIVVKAYLSGNLTSSVIMRKDRTLLNSSSVIPLSWYKQNKPYISIIYPSKLKGYLPPSLRFQPYILPQSRPVTSHHNGGEVSGVTKTKRRIEFEKGGYWVISNFISWLTFNTNCFTKRSKNALKEWISSLVGSWLLSANKHVQVSIERKSSRANVPGCCSFSFNFARYITASTMKTKSRLETHHNQDLWMHNKRMNNQTKPVGNVLTITLGIFYSTKISANFGSKLNWSVRSNWKR